jgi:hypothetical protein
MTMQFSDHREWIREYVTNAFDASATQVRITGSEQERTLTIVVSDNGHGMDRQGVLDFMMLYRTRKPGKEEQAIGQHGIGKLSVAAIAGQCGYKMMTSTGNECWQFETGCLLDEEPAELQRVEPVPPQGTHFEITFVKEYSIEQELLELRKILELYVRFLPLDIFISSSEREGKLLCMPINSDWHTTMGTFGRKYRIELRNMVFEATVGIGNGEHELYQRRVLVSSSYNLLSADLEHELTVPYLRIRLDSADFELPFGRHALRNDEVLKPVAKYLREEVVPDYLRDVYQSLRDEQPPRDASCLFELESIAIALLAHDPTSGGFVSQVPLFRDVYGQRFSLHKLKQEAKTHGVLYLESEDMVGVDYAVFTAPVLAEKQPDRALDLLRDAFRKELINLGMADVVIEAPPNGRPALGPMERRFEQHLRFHPTALQMNLARSAKKRERQGRSMHSDSSPDKDFDRSLGVCQEARQAKDDVESLTWRVSYLVGRDGKTPAPMRRYLSVGNAVVLNLYHPDVQHLLSLSEKAPALAGHFGLAMVLSDPRQNILKHLSAEAREDLIVADALAKCGSDELPVTQGVERHSTEMWDWLLDTADGSSLPN